VLCSGLGWQVAASGAIDLRAGLYCLMVASSADFLTPFGYQCNLMIQKPGGYSFLDYTKLGLPVTLIGLVLCPLIAMFVWPLQAASPLCLSNCTNATSVMAPALR
jgi:di/tricarboxylate transporter